jgi:flagellar biosynthesis anti-sigma factor FlgM
MQIYGPSHLHGAQSINGPHSARTPQPETASPTSAASDQLDLSQAGQIAARMSEIPDVRQDRVNAIRAAIQNGTYETADKLSGAVDRLLDEIG